MNVLISCAGRRNQLVDYFKDCKRINSVHCCDMDLYAPSWEKADKCHVTPAFDSPNYVDRLRDICVEENIDILISLNDFELPILAKHKAYLERTGARVIVSSPEVIDTCLDKSHSATFLSENGFDLAKEYQASDIVDGTYLPLVIKPRFGTGSIGVEIAHSSSDFNVLLDYSKLKVAQSSIAKNIVQGDQLLIQELVQGTEYAVDIINDLESVYCGCVIKRKLGVRGGDASVVVTERNSEIEHFARRLGECLGHVGVLDTDIIVSDSGIYCVDMNPRFGGAYPFSYLSGVNVPEMIIDWCGDQKHHSEISYADGVVTTRTETYYRLEKYRLATKC